MENDLIKLKITKPRRELLSALNIHSIDDLLSYYPYRYEYFMKTLPTENDPKIIASAIVFTTPKLAYKRGNMSKMIFDVSIDNQIYHCSIFNRHFLRTQLTLGKEITILGKVGEKYHTIILSDVKLQPLSSLNPIVPVYSSKEGITSKSIAQYITKAIDYKNNAIENFIPQEYLEKYRLINRSDAIKFVHQPIDNHEIKHALRHLKYEEFLKYQLMVQYLNKYMDNQEGIKKYFDRKIIDDFIKTLPFELTKDQATTINEVLNDLESPKVMHRLIQGDVGCGKTMVALIGLLANKRAGYQGALMAPTEILAKQHYYSIKNSFKDSDIKIDLLIGSLTNKEKEEVYRKLINNEIDIIIGTHALIQEKVNFYDLGLVIADEQHRFGVKQRETLRKKGNKVDFLLMSATPIPRTLAISLFGDMDVSTIKSMPLGRKDVITKFYKSTTLKPALKFFNNYLLGGGQCYIVCPLVEESESSDLKDVTNIYNGMNKYYKDRYNVGLLHGKMKDHEKEEIMNKFKKNDIQILVTTTVIEVGVDVSNANVMVIYNSDRFGLSQLHQLRGRVGRGNQQGYCFLLSNIDNEESINRIKYMEKTNDGFEISSYDLKLRGPGEVLGSRQSGIPTFSIAEIFEDFTILKKASEDATEIINHLHLYKPIYEFLINKINENNLIS